jgi:hypothetical protein
MKNNKWGILLLMMVFFASACSSNPPVDHSKPEMGVQQDDSSRPPRTFNQFHNEWDY